MERHRNKLSSSSGHNTNTSKISHGQSGGGGGGGQTGGANSFSGGMVYAPPSWAGSLQSPHTDRKAVLAGMPKLPNAPPLSSSSSHGRTGTTTTTKGTTPPTKGPPHGSGIIVDTNRIHTNTANNNSTHKPPQVFTSQSAHNRWMSNPPSAPGAVPAVAATASPSAFRTAFGGGYTANTNTISTAHSLSPPPSQHLHLPPVPVPVPPQPSEPMTTNNDYTYAMDDFNANFPAPSKRLVYRRKSGSGGMGGGGSSSHHSRTIVSPSAVTNRKSSTTTTTMTTTTPDHNKQQHHHHSRRHHRSHSNGGGGDGSGGYFYDIEGNEADEYDDHSDSESYHDHHQYPLHIDYPPSPPTMTTADDPSFVSYPHSYLSSPQRATQQQYHQQQQQQGWGGLWSNTNTNTNTTTTTSTNSTNLHIPSAVPGSGGGILSPASGLSDNEEDDWFDTITSILQPHHLRIRKRRRRRRSPYSSNNRTNLHTTNPTNNRYNSNRGNGRSGGGGIRRTSSTSSKNLPKRKTYICCLSSPTHIFIQLCILGLFGGAILWHAQKSVAQVKQELQDSHVEKTNILHQMEWIEKRAKSHMTTYQQQQQKLQLQQQQQGGGGGGMVGPLNDKGSSNQENNNNNIMDAEYSDLSPNLEEEEELAFQEAENRANELGKVVHSLHSTLKETARWQIQQMYGSNSDSVQVVLNLAGGGGGSDGGTGSSSTTKKKTNNNKKASADSSATLKENPLIIQVSHDLVPYMSWMWLTQLQQGQWDNASMEYHRDTNVLEIIPSLTSKQQQQNSKPKNKTTRGGGTANTNGDPTAGFLQFFESSIGTADESFHVGLRRIILRKIKKLHTNKNNGPKEDNTAGFDAYDSMREGLLEEDEVEIEEEDRLALIVHFNAGTCGPTGLYRKDNNMYDYIQNHHKHYHLQESTMEDENNDDEEEEIIIDEVCFGTLVNGFDSLERLQVLFQQERHHNNKNPKNPTQKAAVGGGGDGTKEKKTVGDDHDRLPPPIEGGKGKGDGKGQEASAGSAAKQTLDDPNENGEIRISFAKIVTHENN